MTTYRPTPSYLTPLRTDFQIITNPERGAWSLVLPIERTNMITNPSIEIATTNYTAVGGSIARSATQSYHGAYSLAITPTAALTDGAFYGTVSLTQDVTYAVSCKVRGIAGVNYRLGVRTALGSELTGSSFRATGRWQWVSLFWKETNTNTRRIYLTKDGSTNTGVFYLDGLQVEACAAEQIFATTYIDGDQQGLLPNQSPPAYSWNGTPHASTSTRIGQTRAGGRVVGLQEFYKLILIGMLGFGLIPPEHTTIPYASLDGAGYQDTRWGSRDFAIVGQFDSYSPTDLHRLRKALSADLSRDRLATRQPVKLLYQPFDGAQPQGDMVEIVASYVDGLEGDTSRQAVQETATITFSQWLPMIKSSDQGAALTVQATIASGDYFLERSPAGLWQLLSTAPNGDVRVAKYGPDGMLYVGGSFTDIGGSGADRLARWDGSSWSFLGSATAVTGSVEDMCWGNDGSLYITGNFLNLNADANADYIARWNGSAWSALGTGANNVGRAVACRPSDGMIFLGGDFTDVGGSGADYVAQWNPVTSTWSVVGSATSLNASVSALAAAPSGAMVVGGSFTNADGIANADFIASWSGSAWSALSTGMSAGVFAAAFDQAGRLYAGGTFTTAGGVSANRIAMWNGSAWSALGTGLDAAMQEMAISPTGEVYVGGTFSTAGGLTVPRAAVWNGSAWRALNILPAGGLGTVDIYAIGIKNTGQVALGFNGTGTASTPGLTSITNRGSMAASPTVIIKGPSTGSSRIYELTNQTTGVGLFFDLTIFSGETITIVLDPANIKMTSDTRGNMISTILKGSDPAGFLIQPGVNSIGLLSVSNTVTAWLYWPVSHGTLDDSVYTP